MIPIQVFNSESGKQMEIRVEETVTVLKLMQKLTADGIIDNSTPYYLKTKDGTIYEPATLLRTIKDKDREFILIQGVPPPAPAFSQLGIFVIDGSASMKEGIINGDICPADVVNEALKKTIFRFNNSRKKQCFSFAVVVFGDTAKAILDPQSVIEIDQTKSFVATDFFANGFGSESTNISSGLSIAFELANNFIKNKKGHLIHKVTVVLLTDGMCHHEKETRAIAKELKQLPGLMICSCHLETGTNETEAVALLKDISDNYATVYDAETIRAFFEYSISIKRG